MNRNVVVREIDRADVAVIDGLAAAGTATVHEAIGRVGYAGPELRPIQQDVRIAGRRQHFAVLPHHDPVPSDGGGMKQALQLDQPRNLVARPTIVAA